MIVSNLSRIRRAVAVAAAAVAVVAVAGCSSDDSSETESATCVSESTLGDARSIDLAPARVTVTNPGTGEQRVPASAPATDAPQRITLTTESTENSIVTGQDGVQATAETLTTPLTVRAGCTDPKTSEFTVARPTSPDAALDPELAGMDGARGGVRFGDGLAPQTLRLAPPEGATPPAARALEQSLVNALNYTVPLPTTPVAPGAVWTAERTVSAAMTVTQTMTVTLKSWDGDRLVLDVRVDESPTDPVFRIPGSSDTLDVTQYANTGTGTLTVDLGELLPVDGSLKLEGARELVGSDAAKPILQKTALTVTWAPTA